MNRYKAYILFLFVGTLVTTITACQSEGDLDFSRYYSTGSLVYQSKCQNCHGVNGEGLGQLIPPLNDSTFLKINKAQLACFIKFGLKGNVTVAFKNYSGTMPRQDDLASVEIAQVLTYVTNSFGNKIGLTDTKQVDACLSKCQ